MSRISGVRMCTLTLAQTIPKREIINISDKYTHGNEEPEAAATSSGSRLRFLEMRVKVQNVKIE